MLDLFFVLSAAIITFLPSMRQDVTVWRMVMVLFSWLGHSDFSTTANIYSHLDYTAKLNSAETLVTSLDFAPEPKMLPG